MARDDREIWPSINDNTPDVCRQKAANGRAPFLALNRTRPRRFQSSSRIRGVHRRQIGCPLQNLLAVAVADAGPIAALPPVGRQARRQGDRDRNRGHALLRSGSDSSDCSELCGHPRSVGRRNALLTGFVWHGTRSVPTKSGNCFGCRIRRCKRVPDGRSKTWAKRTAGKGGGKGQQGHEAKGPAENRGRDRG